MLYANYQYNGMLVSAKKMVDVFVAGVGLVQMVSTLTLAVLKIWC